jgi:hypothetical protein
MELSPSSEAASGAATQELTSILWNQKVHYHVRWVACHHGMERPQVSDAGGSLQFWRVAANILNKQSRTADKRWSFSLGLGVGLSTPHHKK